MFVFVSYFKAFLEQRQLGDDVRDRIGQRFLRRIMRRGLDADDEFVLERMRILVAGEQDIRVLQQLAVDLIKCKRFINMGSTRKVMGDLLADHVAQSVILFIDGKDGCVGYLRV